GVTTGMGIERRWVMTCHNCGKLTIVAGRRCGICEWDLDIPVIVRLWTFFTGRGEGSVTRRLRWWIHLLGSVTFLLLSFCIVTSSAALAPLRLLPRLFLRFAFLALAVFRWLAGC